MVFTRSVLAMGTVMNLALLLLASATMDFAAPAIVQPSPVSAPPAAIDEAVRRAQQAIDRRLLIIKRQADAARAAGTAAENRRRDEMTRQPRFPGLTD